MFEKFKWYIQDHQFEMKVATIGLVITLGIALAIGGNIDALAQSRRR